MFRGFLEFTPNKRAPSSIIYNLYPNASRNVENLKTYNLKKNFASRKTTAGKPGAILK